MKLLPILVACVFILSACGSEKPHPAYGKLALPPGDYGALTETKYKEVHDWSVKILNEIADYSISQSSVEGVKSRIAEYSETYDISEIKDLDIKSLRELITLKLIDSSYVIIYTYTGKVAESGDILIHLVMLQAIDEFDKPSRGLQKLKLSIVDESYDRVERKK